MKKKYVQEGVFLVCDKGTIISRLKNLHYQEITLFNNTFATRKDKKLFVNFDMFGSCSTCNGCPCTAPVTDWTNITDGITIDGNELLLENSELPCAKGGNIKIFYTKQSATNALPKKKKSFWDFLSDGAKTSFSFQKGFYTGLWKGLKGTVTSIVDLVVWASKHQTIYALANPVEYDKLLQKDAEMMKKLGKLAKKGSIWLYRNSKINLYNNPTDYFLAQTENAQMMDKLLDKVSKMSAEESGDFTGQLGFEIILELGTGGGAFALSAIKVADKGLDVVKAVERLGDVSDALKTAEKLEDISDGIKTMENLNDTKPLKIGEVTYQTENAISNIVPMLKGKIIDLPNMIKTSFNYIKRCRNETRVLRDAFNRSERKKFLKKLGKNEDLLKQKGFSKSDIMKIKDGKVPTGYQVHHKYPLDDGGNNSFDNLVLIKNDPYHKALTNYQNIITNKMSAGDSKNIIWYTMEGSIYP